MKILKISEKVSFWILLIICVGLFIAQFRYIIKFAVNIPFYDEWEGLTENGILLNQTISGLFAQHNEHRIVTTNLLTLALYYIDGWNIITHQIINFFLYGILLVSINYVIKKSVPQLPGWILLAFTIFLLTNISWENHFWAFQSQFHFALIFLFFSIYFLFDQKQNWSLLFVGVFFSWLTTYSFSSGLVESLVVLVCFIGFKFVRIYRTDNKQTEIRQLLVTSILIGGAIGAYFIGFSKNEGHPPFAFPFQKEFWLYFLNLLSGGFGYKSLSLLPGIIILFFVSIPLIGIIKKYSNEIPPKTWIVVAANLAILGALGSITMGRAGFGEAHAKSSRYTEIVVMLIPLTVAIWTIFLAHSEKARNYVLAVYFIFCILSFSNFSNSSKPDFVYFNYNKAYREAVDSRLKGYQCVKDFYLQKGDGNCSTIYPAPIADRLELIKSLKISFEEEINNPK